jgi:hypothetical protein
MLKNVGGERHIRDPRGQRQQIPVRDDGPVGRFRPQLPYVRLEEIGVSAAPPKLLSEIPTPTTDVHDCAPGNGPVVALDLISSITGEE